MERLDQQQKDLKEKWDEQDKENTLKRQEKCKEKARESDEENRRRQQLKEEEQKMKIEEQVNLRNKNKKDLEHQEELKKRWSEYKDDEKFCKQKDKEQELDKNL